MAKLSVPNQPIDVEASWKAARTLVGIAVHASFRARQQSLGYANHRWNPSEHQHHVICMTCYEEGPRVLGRAKHHDHQVPWEKLTPGSRESYIRQGEAPWLLGYMRALEDVKGAAEGRDGA